MSDNFYKRELLQHFNRQMAFVPVTDLIDKIPNDKLGTRPAGLPYSFYEVFYHIVFAQKDILKFMQTGAYDLPNWPEDYWPGKKGPDDETVWQNLKTGYRKDCAAIRNLLSAGSTGLDRPVEHASGEEQTHFREMLLILNHTAYHTGQLLVILRLLGAWD